MTKRNEYSQLFGKWNSAADFIVAYNKDVLGYAILYVNNWNTKVAYITLIAVLPKWQGMHIGKSLLKEAEMLAMEHGMETMKLEVAVSNIKAICFYEKNGYVKESENGVTSIYMIKHL